MTEFPLSPFPTPAELARREQRHRLLNLAVVCAVTLALVGLAACGPADVDIARSGVPATVPKVVPMSAVPAVPLVTTTTAPPVTAAPTTSALPLQEVAEPPVPQAVTPAGPVEPSDAFAALAACESTGDRDGLEPHRINPVAVNPTGTYLGAFQFDAATWASVGGTGDPAAQPYAEQLHRARLLQAERGWSPWPHCSELLGMR